MPDDFDPPEPPEGGNRLNAKNLKNRVLVIRPTRFDTIPGTKPNSKGEIKPWTFVEADVWVLDRSGVEAQESEVRFSWWRAVGQLQERIGQFVACRPVEQEDNSVVLAPLAGGAREVAAKVIAEIQAGEHPTPDQTESEQTGDYDGDAF